MVLIYGYMIKGNISAIKDRELNSIVEKKNMKWP